MKKKAPTQKDVARVAGVSQAAVSRFVSGKGALSEAVRDRILQAITMVDYRPDALGRGLSNGQSDIVAVVMANLTNPWYPVVLERITRELHARGLQALLFNAAPPHTVDDLLPLVLQYRVRGVIITTASLTSHGADLCVRHGVPVVMFNRYSQIGAGHAVSCDNVAGGRLAADLLRKSGARAPAYIGGIPEVSTNRDRKRGFVERLFEAGMVPAQVEREYTYDWGYEACLTLMRQNPAIDALFCADDEIASGAMDALRHELGKRVPQDVRVLGFDDHPVASRASYRLTTIRQPVEQMIPAALELLLGTQGAPQSRVFPGELIVRDTVPMA